ncbi:MAG: hypothetical protein K6E84_09110 [Lachnospiraceae bacterium]|nr:hypothetical protein [Lachnospiraceae bacterium]
MDILFCEGSKRKTTTLRAETVKDLALEEIIESIASNEKNNAIIKNIFTRIPEDISDIRYRQEILKDFCENEELCEQVSDSLGLITTLKDYGRSAFTVSGENLLYSLLGNLREVSTYIQVSERLVEALRKHEVRSAGLCNLKAQLERVVEDEHFETSKKDVEKMLEDLSVVKGALIGVNFTPDLNVESVAAIEFVDHKLRSRYTFAELAASIGNIVNFSTSSNSVRMNQNIYVQDPLLVNMTPLMEKHLKQHFFRIRSFLKKYIDLDGSFLTEMYEGLTFYTCMARFSRRLKDKGMEICFPTLRSEADENSGISFRMKDLYNIRLFLSGETDIVKNDFAFSPTENLFILTGPNRGGKTILEQALGIISVMASVGGFVTAAECDGRPFCNILTHFPIDENLTINYGRLGEEAVRIREIVKEADQNTLILFNETYSTTSAVDGLYLSKDLLHILKKMGTSVIFNTHIHEVARSIEEMNDWEGESRVVSLVMEIRDNQNTFKIKRSAPDSKSYAQNIAKKYGITFDQMVEMRDEKSDHRQMVPDYPN